MDIGLAANFVESLLQRHGIGLSQKQEAILVQVVGQARHDFFLHGRIKVDQHIAAKDHIEPGIDGVMRCQQVDGTKLDGLLQTLLGTEGPKGEKRQLYNVEPTLIF